ncbi:hypothetical protein niasHT_011879 [Heterodera trifolii]|uniref:Receptor expression-enhancing protein n=1 Tax=Heterodera trifolii TaxID=157864 RepID=A0ABD2KU71_9BILA
MSSDESTTSSSDVIERFDLNDVLPPGMMKPLNQFLFYVASFLVLLLFVLFPGNMFLSTLITVPYPMYASLLTLNTQNTSEFTQWLVYWCVFAVFGQLDFLFGFINGLLLLYVPLKTVFLLYLAIYMKHIRKWIAMTNLLED